jgi:hypothetical protein
VAAVEAAVDAEDEQDDDEQADAGRDEAADEELLWIAGTQRRGRRTARPRAGRARLVIVEEGQESAPWRDAGGSV